MIFRQLFDAQSSTYTYLVADETTREAALIDPVLEQVDRDLELVRDLGLTLVYVLDTHVHADHVTGAGVLRERTGAKTVASQKGAPCVDVHVSRGELLRVGSIELQVLATPGHTDDSVSYVVGDPQHPGQPGDRVFTGDALLVRGCGRTDFQSGEPVALHASITKVLFALPDSTLVYPAHDYLGHTVTTIGEEKRLNPRVAGRSEAEFVAFMRALKLPAPKRIDEAVPANRACGLVAAIPQG
ncbi:MBL fold metallo-hydrolase [soil metagenome]